MSGCKKRSVKGEYSTDYRILRIFPGHVAHCRYDWAVVSKAPQQSSSGQPCWDVREEGREIQNAATEQKVQARERLFEKPDIFVGQLQAIYRLHECRADGTVKNREPRDQIDFRSTEWTGNATSDDSQA